MVEFKTDIRFGCYTDAPLTEPNPPLPPHTGGGGSQQMEPPASPHNSLPSPPHAAWPPPPTHLPRHHTLPPLTPQPLLPAVWDLRHPPTLQPVQGATVATQGPEGEVHCF